MQIIEVPTICYCLEFIGNYYKVNSETKCLTYFSHVTNAKGNTRMKQGIAFEIYRKILKVMWEKMIIENSVCKSTFINTSVVKVKDNFQ